MAGVTTSYQAGVHGSRPAASAGCILYSCSTHGLVYRSDGTSWTTWLTLPSGVSSASPALTFGTSAAAGAASTYVATDATLPIFDATVPTTQAFADAAAAGSAGVAARRDHKHAMPASPAPGASTSFTPTLTAASVNPTLGSGSSYEGHYMQIGKLVVMWGVINFGSSGVAPGTGEYRAAYPVAPISGLTRVMGPAKFYDSSAGGFYLMQTYGLDTTNFRFSVDRSVAGPTLGSSTPVVPAANDIIIFHATYESA